MSQQSTHARIATEQTHSRDWRRAYAKRLAITDLLVVVWVVFGSQIAWLETTSRGLGFLGGLRNVAVSYSIVSIVLVLAWMATLSAFGTRGFRVIGTGSTEYRLVANAAVRLFGILAIFAMLFKIDLARGYIITAFPVGLLVLLLSRWMWRQWLNLQRERGIYSDRVLLVGSIDKVAHLGIELAKRYSAGYTVIGACVPQGHGESTLSALNIPVLGNLDEVVSNVVLTSADAVVIAGADSLTTEAVRQMSWDLEVTQAELIVAPSLIDVAGSRIHSRPVSGLPLIHVEIPRFEGRKQVAKLALDFGLATVMIVVLSPVLLIVALLVKVTSPGSILFRQDRVGLNGKHFRVFKFRTMVMDAEDRLDEFDDSDITTKTLFKPRNDPRVTKLGRFLRRYSIDELPQLFNVIGGSMSLVGPRPHPVREVLKYEAIDRRRLLVRPGLTGLWQVGGRSRLSWEESVRLDLYYVENWSLAGDLVILWRTLKAVIGADGAY